MFLFIKKYISTQVKHTILHLKSELFKSQVMIQVVAISAYATCKCFPRLCSHYSSRACFNLFKRTDFKLSIQKINAKWKKKKKALPASVWATSVIQRYTCLLFSCPKVFSRAGHLLIRSGYSLPHGPNGFHLDRFYHDFAFFLLFYKPHSSPLPPTPEWIVQLHVHSVIWIK